MTSGAALPPPHIPPHAGRTPALRHFLAPFAALAAIGIAWGMTTPMMKVAVSAGHQPFGIMLWQMSLAALLMTAILAARGRLRIPLGTPEIRLYVAVAALGMVLPNFFSYTAMRHLPSGVMSIIISMVPIFALPLALMAGAERFRPLRALGLAMGAAAMVLIAAPEASLPESAVTAFIAVAALTPLCYALEGLYVSGSGSRASGPMQTLLGATVVALVVVAPLALATGQAISPFAPWGMPEIAIVAAGVVSTLCYAGYVALLRATGAVFAAQVAYLVTGSGVVWAMLLLGERYSGWVWAALALLFAGLFLVQPRPQLPEILVPEEPAQT